MSAFKSHYTGFQSNHNTNLGSRTTITAEHLGDDANGRNFFNSIDTQATKPVNNSLKIEKESRERHRATPLEDVCEQVSGQSFEEQMGEYVMSSGGRHHEPRQSEQYMHSYQKQHPTEEDMEGSSQYLYPDEKNFERTEDMRPMTKQELYDAYFGADKNYQSQDHRGDQFRPEQVREYTTWQPTFNAQEDQNSSGISNSQNRRQFEMTRPCPQTRDYELLGFERTQENIGFSQEQPSPGKQQIVIHHRNRSREFEYRGTLGFDDNHYRPKEPSDYMPSYVLSSSAIVTPQGFNSEVNTNRGNQNFNKNQTTIENETEEIENYRMQANAQIDNHREELDSIPSDIHGIQLSSLGPTAQKERFEILQTRSHLNDFNQKQTHANLRNPVSPSVRPSSPRRKESQEHKLMASQSMMFNGTSTLSLNNDRTLNILRRSSQGRRFSSQASPEAKEEAQMLKRSKTNKGKNMRYCINKLYQKATGIPPKHQKMRSEHRANDLNQTQKQSSLNATLRKVERSCSPTANKVRSTSLRRKQRQSNSPVMNLIQTPYSQDKTEVSVPLRTKSSKIMPPSHLDNHYDKSEMEYSSNKASMLIQKLQPVPCTRDDVSIDAIPSRLADKHPSSQPTASKSADKLARFRKIEREMEQERLYQQMEDERRQHEAQERERQIRLQQLKQQEDERRYREKVAQKQLEEKYQREKQQRLERERQEALEREKEQRLLKLQAETEERRRQQEMQSLSYHQQSFRREPDVYGNRERSRIETEEYQQSFYVFEQDQMSYQDLNYRQEGQSITYPDNWSQDRPVAYHNDDYQQFQPQRFQQPPLPIHREVRVSLHAPAPTYNSREAPRNYNGRERKFREIRQRMQQEEEERQQRYRESTLERLQRQEFTHSQLITENGLGRSQPNFEGGSLESQFEQRFPLNASHINSFREQSDEYLAEPEQKMIFSQQHFYKPPQQVNQFYFENEDVQSNPGTFTIESQSKTFVRRSTREIPSKKTIEMHQRVNTEMESQCHNFHYHQNIQQNSYKGLQSVRDLSACNHCGNPSLSQPTSHNEYLSMTNIGQPIEQTNNKQLDEQKEIALNLEKQVSQLNEAINSLKEDHALQIQKMQEFCTQQISQIREEYERQRREQEEAKKQEVQMIPERLESSQMSNTYKSLSGTSQNKVSETRSNFSNEASELIAHLMNQDNFKDTVQQLNKAVGQKQNLEQKLMRIKEKIKQAKKIKESMSLTSNNVQSSIYTENFMTSLTNTHSEMQKSNRGNQKPAHVLAYQDEYGGVYHTANFAPSTILTQTIQSKQTSPKKGHKDTEREAYQIQPSIEQPSNAETFKVKKNKDKEKRKEKRLKKDQIPPKPDKDQFIKIISPGHSQSSPKISLQNSIPRQQSTMISPINQTSHTMSRVMSHNISEQALTKAISRQEFEDQLHYNYIPKDLIKSKTDNMSGISKIDSASNFNSHSHLHSSQLKSSNLQSNEQSAQINEQSCSNLSEVNIVNPFSAYQEHPRPSISSVQKSMDTSYREEEIILKDDHSEVSTPQRCYTMQQMQLQQKENYTFNPDSQRKQQLPSSKLSLNQDFQMYPEQLMRMSGVGDNSKRESSYLSNAHKLNLSALHNPNLIELTMDSSNMVTQGSIMAEQHVVYTRVTNKAAKRN